MRATIILCDFAQVSEGKLTVVGAGWHTLNGPAPMGIGAIFEIAWVETNTPHRFRFDIVDQDDQAVMVPTPQGLQPTMVEGALEVGRPPGSLHGTTFVNAFAFNTAPIPFQHPGRYRWRLFIDEEANDEWQRAFTVADAAVIPMNGPT